jgi:hypothetical protein
MSSAFSYLALAGISAHVSSVAFVEGSQGDSSASPSATLSISVDDTRVRRSVTITAASHAAGSQTVDKQS